MGADVISMLLEFNQERQTTIVMVTHDAAMAEQTRRTLRIFDGRQVQ